MKITIPHIRPIDPKPNQRWLFSLAKARMNYQVELAELHPVLGGSMRDLPDGVFLGGGSFRSMLDGTEVSDFDVFFSSEEKATEFQARAVLNGATVKWECPVGSLANLEYNGKKIQLIKVAYYRDAWELIESFDITACQFAMDNTALYTFSRSIRDAFNMELGLDRVAFPAATMRRMFKYIEKGYSAKGKSLLDIVRKIQAAPLDGENSRLYVD